MRIVKLQFKSDRKFVIEDSGIGMTHDELALTSDSSF
jgi:HSP90 family molecular chaperone